MLKEVLSFLGMDFIKTGTCVKHGCPFFRWDRRMEIPDSLVIFERQP